MSKPTVIIDPDYLHEIRAWWSQQQKHLTETSKVSDEEYRQAMARVVELHDRPTEPMAIVWQTWEE